MRVAVRIGGVSQLWMPVPREWDGIGMTDVQVLDIFPPPTDRYQDATGNEVAYWQIEDQSSREYGIEFEVCVRPIVYDIDPDSIGEYDTGSELSEECTAPSDWVQSDDPDIITLAQEIVGGETNPYRQAQLLHRWVAANISGGGDTGSALQALHNRRGTCGGHSFLFVALLRALGIPARSVSGWHTVYQGQFTSGSARSGTFHQHIWAEFYHPGHGWIQADTSAGLQNFAGINEPRIVTSRGEDIELGHGFPLGSIPFFQAPQSNVLTPSTPATQTWGEDFRLEVEKLQ